MLIYLIEEGLKYKPDIVILGFISSDRERNMLSFRDYAKPKFELIKGKLCLGNTPVPSIEATLKSEIWKSKFFDYLKIVNAKNSQRTKSYRRKEQDTMMGILNEFVLTVKKANARPIFIYLTNLRGKEVFDDLEQNEDAKEFAQYCQARGVDCIFPQPYVLSAIKEGKKIKLDGHWDATTNYIIASTIKMFLIERKVITNYQKEKNYYKDK